MRFNVFNNILNMGQVYDSISSSFLDYMPTDKFRETTQPAEADIIFMQGAIHPNSSVGINAVIGMQSGLLNIAQNATMVNAVANAKARIVWFDTMGPNLHKDANLLSEANTGLRDTDIVLSMASLPAHPNLFVGLSHVSKNDFKAYKRFDRIPGTVMISHDNLVPEAKMVAGVMDKVNKLHVTKASTLDPNAAAFFGDQLPKVECKMLSYPKGVAYLASRCEFVMHTHTTWGAEFMGIEAGMCGAQPIYPGTEFYRDIFDDTGVLFYDVNDAVGSLREIIASGSDWDYDKIEAFRSKFSGEDNLPQFWEQVYQICSEIPESGRIVDRYGDYGDQG